MRPNARLRARITVIVCATLLGLAAAARPVVAGGEYLLDIKGTVEILGDASEPGDSKSGREVHYWVTFQYRDPAVQGPSFLDRQAQVENGQFEVSDLRPDKVYRVVVQRVIIDPSLPGGGSREEIPLYVPADFWASVEISPKAPPPEPVKIELAVAAPGGSNEPPRSLLLQYNGKEVRLAAFTAEPGVS